MRTLGTQYLLDTVPAARGGAVICGDSAIEKLVEAVNGLTALRALHVQVPPGRGHRAERRAALRAPVRHGGERGPAQADGDDRHDVGRAPPEPRGGPCRTTTQVLGVEPGANMRVGASDARVCRRAGITTVICGLTPNTMGAPDEYVQAEELMALGEIFTRGALAYLTSAH